MKHVLPRFISSRSLSLSLYIYIYYIIPVYIYIYIYIHTHTHTVYMCVCIYIYIYIYIYISSQPVVALAAVVHWTVLPEYCYPVSQHSEEHRSNGQGLWTTHERKYPIMADKLSEEGPRHHMKSTSIVSYYNGGNWYYFRHTTSGVQSHKSECTTVQDTGFLVRVVDPVELGNDRSQNGR